MCSTLFLFGLYLKSRPGMGSVGCRRRVKGGGAGQQGGEPDSLEPKCHNLPER